MRPIATDTSDFPKLREKGCIYVDKTDWKWEKYPIIHFEFNDVTTTSITDFETSFAIHVQERADIVV